MTIFSHHNFLTSFVLFLAKRQRNESSTRHDQRNKKKFGKKLQIVIPRQIVIPSEARDLFANR
jgi:hypothetical protein